MSMVILRRLVPLSLNFRLKGYVSCQYLRNIRWGNGYTTLQRSTGSFDSCDRGQMDARMEGQTELPSITATNTALAQLLTR